MIEEKVLVLGIGNLLLGDEGVGVHVARALQSEELPASAIVLEVGTAFLDALSDIEEASRIIIIDAMKAGHSPGTVYRVPAGKCVKPQCIASLHGFDLSRVLFLAGKTSSPEAVVFGVEPSRIDWGIELSPEIQNIIPTVVEVIKTEIRKPRFPSGIE
jgi:hydrogenase maturation protease